MTVKTNRAVSRTWEILKGIGIGVGIYIGTGILDYEKKNYDFNVTIHSRIEALESSAAISAGNVAKRQEYEKDNDKVVNMLDKKTSFLYARLKLKYEE